MNQKYKYLLLLCVVAVVFGVVSLAGGAVLYRPNNPTMDYVPQNVGIYDTYYCYNKESDCRVCHGSSTAERHHATQTAREGNCLYCHRDWPYTVPPERDCKVCHIDSSGLNDFDVGYGPGDLTYPHHRTDLADSGQCEQCHGSNIVSETNSVEPPNYPTSCITPTPFACENCHWPSGTVYGEASTYQGPNKVAEFAYDWSLWTPTNAPRPTDTPGATPTFIGANGPVTSFITPLVADLWHLPDGGANNRWGVNMITKPYRPAEGLHHEGVGKNDAKVYPHCYNCHAPDPGSPISTDPNNASLIRYCENCHDTGTLHYGIPEHVTTGGGSGLGYYRVGGVADQVVTADEKCVACHEGVAANCPLIGMPEVPAEAPQIDHLEPNFGSKGVVVDILPATGACWIEDPVNGLCSFGVKGTGDWVKVGQWDTLTMTWVYYDVPIYSWSEHLIQIKLEGYDFSPGGARIKVHKQNPLWTSPYAHFTIMEHPTITSLNPPVGNYGDTITINGSGFNAKREKIVDVPHGYGYSSYVELWASNDVYRIKQYPIWTPNRIDIVLEHMLDTKSVPPGQEVPGAQELYVGCWNVKVITDYFKDNPTDGLVGEYIDHSPAGNNNVITGLLDTDDELLYREISEPMCLTVTKDPFINCIRPNPVPGGDTVTMYGSNFGPVQSTSIVKEWAVNKKGIRSAINYVVPKIISWTNTEIKFKVKPGKPLLPKTKDVQVVLNPSTPQQKVSNFYRLVVTPH